MILKSVPKEPGLPGGRIAAARFAIAAILLAGLSSQSVAQTYCSKPIRPICAESLVDANDEAQKRLCLEDLGRYEETLKEYASCLEGSLEDSRAELEKATKLRQCLEDEKSSDCTALDE
jgi:hypothetical protein